jgi:gluconolactonase
MSFRTSEFRLIAKGLEYPEGPVYQSDGSILLVEIHKGTLTRVDPNGGVQTIVDFGAVPNAPSTQRIACGPNGTAIGPNSDIYVCDDGGMTWMPIPGSAKNLPTLVALGQPPDYKTGCIQRVSGNTFTTLYSQCNGSRLCSPDDLVFDATGNFWFTDWGKARATDRDITGVYYAAPDGSKITQMIPQRSAPNGIGLSPDDQRLYVAETYARWIRYWELDSPGVIKPNPATMDGSYLLTAAIPGQGTLDSMAVDEEGNVYVATMLPLGLSPTVPGGITVVSPHGKILDFIELMVEGMPEPLPSNLCFGGQDRKTAFITLAGTGRLAACEMKIPGKLLHFAK